MTGRKVFDRKNKERFLGTLLGVPARRPRDHLFNVAVYRPDFFLRPPGPDEEYDIARQETIRVLTFEYSELRSPCGWDAEGILLTDAKLSDLLELREFVLPGETARDSKERQYRRAYR